ncbi:hypothetical protein NDU88_005838 [Pleurodeles waltl]|uniref:Uncharacterized protein n=1 Tax=Pleurodeles waltl TaxID=8319 RepID=A0AAV7TCF7_PLEWA|nr:hypothetical protein NDU88_005838 [Pleurodeles waltl]
MAHRVNASGNYLGRLAPHFSPPLLLPELVYLHSAYEEWARFHALQVLCPFHSAVLPCPGALSGSAHAPDSFRALERYVPDQRAAGLVQWGVFPWLQGAPPRTLLLHCLAAAVTPLLLLRRGRGSDTPQPTILQAPVSIRPRSTDSILLSPPASAAPRFGRSRSGLRVSVSRSQLESGRHFV